MISYACGECSRWKHPELTRILNETEVSPVRGPLPSNRRMRSRNSNGQALLNVIRLRCVVQNCSGALHGALVSRPSQPVRFSASSHSHVHRGPKAVHSTISKLLISRAWVIETV